MVATSADSSGKYEEWQAELSQSYGRSGLDHSEDTLEPFSEEEGACWQRESEPSKLDSSTEDLEWSAASDTLESMSRLAGQNHADGPSEVADSAGMERGVVAKWIDLKNKEAGIKQDKSVIKTHAEITELLDGELDALQSFCTIKISKMCQQLISKQANGGKSRKLQHGFTAKKPETSDLNCIVPDRLMNGIRLKNIRESVKQVAEAEIHQSSVCPDCQKKAAELAKVTFLRQKKILMERALIQEKLEEQIYSRGVLTLLGEALRSLPNPSEDPKNLWQRLRGQKMMAKSLSFKEYIWVEDWYSVHTQIEWLYAGDLSGLDGEIIFIAAQKVDAALQAQMQPTSLIIADSQSSLHCSRSDLVAVGLV